MSDNPFTEELARQLSVREELPESLTILQKFCEGVRISTKGQVLCTLERGHLVTVGQEWTAVLRSRYGGPPQSMFRAYVAPDGLPVKLDLHQRPPLLDCDSNATLVKELQSFLHDPNVVEQIRYFMLLRPHDDEDDLTVWQAIARAGTQRDGTKIAWSNDGFNGWMAIFDPRSRRIEFSTAGFVGAAGDLEGTAPPERGWVPAEMQDG